MTGSTGSFLLGLGALHHRLGHHAEAARRLLERVRELDRGADLPADLDRRAPRRRRPPRAGRAGARGGAPAPGRAVGTDMEKEGETAA